MNSAQSVAACLEEMAFLLELSGANFFKVRAYQNAARLVVEAGANFPRFIRLAKEGHIEGIGADLSRKIEALELSGSLSELEELRARFPAGLKQIARIPGLGPRKVRTLHEELQIGSLDELEEACRQGRIAKLKGFGQNSAAKILCGIEQVRAFSGQFLLSEGLCAVQDFLEFMKGQAGLERIEVAGSIRRSNEVVRNINLACCAKDVALVLEHAGQYPTTRAVLERSERQIVLSLASGLTLRLQAVQDASEFAALFRYLTGSREHNRALETLAKEKGYTLGENGLSRGGEPVPLSDEAALYAELGLNFIPPELRENQGEIERAKQSQAADLRLLEASDLKGMLHVHTTYSDGRNSLREMAVAAKSLGYEYLGVCDHSKSAAYAGGLAREVVLEQHAEIDVLNEELAPFKIFKGIESDILADGSLDYPEETLKRFDFIIASVHSYMTMTEEEMTGRLVRAIKNPYTTILGHPSGRLLLERAGYAVDIRAVLETAAQCGAAVELNANPHRLDLDWRHLAQARGLGVKIAIGPDAHALEGLADIRFGVSIARKGGLGKTDVVNCLTKEEFATFIRSRLLAKS